MIILKYSELSISQSTFNTKEYSHDIFYFYQNLSSFYFKPLVSLSKFSGTRKFTWRYQWFGLKPLFRFRELTEFVLVLFPFKSSSGDKFGRKRALR